MNRLGMRIATALVTACVALGAAGIAGTKLPGAPHFSLGNAAAFVSGAMLGAVSMELPGAKAGLGETLLVSGKGAVLRQDGTSPQGEAAPQSEAATESAAEPADSVAENSLPAGGPAAAAEPGEENAVASAERKLVFIYHSHNRESWLPELPGKDQPNEAFDEKTNVSLLGERLRKKLEEKGVGAVHSGADYQTAVPSFNYNYSYKYSKTTVKEALAVHEDLIYLLDLHRDSSRRGQTTVTIDGKDYARLYFIVGQGNPNWKENEALAETIHEKLERKLPGLSKGILTKGRKHGNGEYNQSLSSGSVLIEIGGVDNTLEESNRTIDALAGIVAELAKEAVKADAEEAEAGTGGEKQ